MLETQLYFMIILSPLISAIVVGLFGNKLGKRISHTLPILGVLIAFICSTVIFYKVQYQNLYYNADLYTWLTVNQQHFSIGILIDKLTSIMLVVVTSVSLMVHIYTIGYMAHEDGYARFFSYISLFTFMMIILVISNNFIQLFFGWEGVGLVSYLLIGFYFTKESAIFANLKAFLINRIGDLGFLLGIGLILFYTGSLKYDEVFASISLLLNKVFPYTNWHIITVICILLFIGAMGKSAQFPLHVWLPDSMEGPTPISALIHAATMVTAGIFMVARLSPLYNHSETALSVIIYAGGINCFFLGILGIIQNDIKRVIAYSTLSQLGYMAVALGCGAYSIAMFHLVTHAFFKGLLFLAAGSVIIAMHHEQDMRNMGGLAKYMPITYITMLIGSLTLAGVPPLSGFYSKDMIITAANIAYANNLSGSRFAVFTVYASVFITALYSFRLIFMTFHGKERFHKDEYHKVHESPIVVTLPLILMTIASILVGWYFFDGFINGSIVHNSVFNANWFIKFVEEEMPNRIHMIKEAFIELPIYLAFLGILISWLCHKYKFINNLFIKLFQPINFVLERKFFMDDLYINCLMPFGKILGNFLWKFGDVIVIDGIIINGLAKLIALYSRIIRNIQSGYVNSYATFMVLGTIILLTFTTKLIFS
jgi:NADH-quinone oxidoreductase subunit L